MSLNAALIAARDLATGEQPSSFVKHEQGFRRIRDKLNDKLHSNARILIDIMITKMRIVCLIVSPAVLLGVYILSILWRVVLPSKSSSAETI